VNQSKKGTMRMSTYCAFVKTTAIDSELQRNKLGAITKAKLAGVIFVTT
jgi:hypothetical protein